MVLDNEPLPEIVSSCPGLYESVALPLQNKILMIVSINFLPFLGSLKRRFHA
jgi:hypothetical protein